VDHRSTRSVVRLPVAASSTPPHGSCFHLSCYGLRERLPRRYGSNSRLPRVQILAQRYGQEAIERNAQLGRVPTPALCQLIR
jgi:hypothetical protein